MRLGTLFVALCVALIAGSIGAALHYGFGFHAAEAGGVAIAMFTLLAIFGCLRAGWRRHNTLNGQMRELSRGNADMARQVAELERRVATLEAAHTTAVFAPTGTAPVTEAVSASIEDRVVTEMRATIQNAIDCNRVDLYLQPIVALPQRKVRYYEAVTRLRNKSGEVVPATDFIAVAHQAGLIATIDHMAMLRCIQVVRRLLLEDREVGLFCNLSTSTLSDDRIFPQLREFLDANRAIAPSVILEFTQRAARQMGSIESERLATLADRGFRFSLDNVTDLRIEPRELAARGFRFVKISAAMLLGRTVDPAAGSRAADIVEALGRCGIDLIAERIESEDAVVELLDHDIRLGQGFLFSPPRPLRAEALGGLRHSTNDGQAHQGLIQE